MGILLIALGIVMLVSQISNVSVIEHIIKWWPVVLIVIGIEILIYIFLSKQDEPKVKFDVFSIIIISILMVASVGAYAITGFISAGDYNISIGSMFDKYKYESTFSKNFSVDAKSSNLVVNNSMGDVDVVKGDGEKIEVEANITINNNDEAYAANIAESLVDIVNGKNIEISSKSKKHSNNGKIGSIRIDYLVRIPDTVNVEVENKFGDVELTDIALNGNVHNDNGKVTVKSLGGNLTVNSSFGDIDVQDIKGEVELYSKNGKVIANNCEKNIKVENAFGDIEVNDIKGVATITNTNGKTNGSRISGDIVAISKFGDVNFSSVSGSIDVDEKNGNINISDVEKDVKITNKFGDIVILNASKAITLDASNGKITLESEKIMEQDVNIENKFGDICLKIPTEQNGYFDAYTKLGSISNDFGIAVNEEVSKESMKGTVGDDKIKFNLNNENGDIKIEKIK